jgi:hypothetical protein
MKRLTIFLNFGLGYGDFVPRVDSSKGDQTGEEVEEFFACEKKLETEKLEKRKVFVMERGQIIKNEKELF